MKPEIEGKWLRIQPEEMRKKLLAIGATLVTPERLMTRVVYDFPDFRLRDNKRAWVRVRNEGDKVTMSYKQADSRSIDGTQEINIEVDSFEAADAFLRALGMIVKSHQETKRESWELDDCQIEIDTWPWIPTFLEIEAPNEETLFAVATRLGLHANECIYGAVEPAYQDAFDLSEDEINSITRITFQEPVPDWIEAKRR